MINITVVPESKGMRKSPVLPQEGAETEREAGVKVEKREVVENLTNKTD